MIGSSEDQARHPFYQANPVEIDQQTKRHIQQLHIAQELGLVHWEHVFDGLQFDEDCRLHQKVAAEDILPDTALVGESDFPLVSYL
jgi:hypothetical protein